MNTNTYTPGPWAFVESSDCRVPDKVMGPDGCDVLRGSIVNRADATLISAAPDLLVALQYALDRLECIPEHRDEVGVYKRAASIARAAITKAQGE